MLGLFLGCSPLDTLFIVNGILTLLIGDIGYQNGIKSRVLEIPVITYDAENIRYICPAGKHLNTAMACACSRIEVSARLQGEAHHVETQYLRLYARCSTGGIRRAGNGEVSKPLVGCSMGWARFLCPPHATGRPPLPQRVSVDLFDFHTSALWMRCGTNRMVRD